MYPVRRSSINGVLKEKVARGDFRQDLYHRFKVVEVTIPPPRERLGDIPLLVDHFRRLFNELFKRNIEGISKDVLSRFMDYGWPGNVRELEHVMEHAFVLCRGGTITMKHLPVDIRNYEWGGNDYAATAPLKKISCDEHDIVDALNKAGWNKSRASCLLGIGRRTIYRKIEQYNIVRRRSGQD